MKAPHHIMKLGRCRRCALGARDNRGYCPPGFWMTRDEIAAWEEAGTPMAQAHVERLAIERRATTSAPTVCTCSTDAINQCPACRAARDRSKADGE